MSVIASALVGLSTSHETEYVLIALSTKNGAPLSHSLGPDASRAPSTAPARRPITFKTKCDSVAVDQGAARETLHRVERVRCDRATRNGGITRPIDEPSAHGVPSEPAAIALGRGVERGSLGDQSSAIRAR
jgi:hypothetical protein